MPIIIIKVCKPEKEKKAECNASINNLIIRLYIVTYCMCLATCTVLKGVHHRIKVT